MVPIDRQMTPEILIDGSNVLFWRGGQADSALPALVVRALIARRFAPVVIFDASVGRHMGPSALEALALSAKVVVAPAGTPADALLLEACGRGRAQIVSNDRFRAWHRQFPGLQNVWLVTGRVGKGGRIAFSKKLRAVPL